MKVLLLLALLIGLGCRSENVEVLNTFVRYEESVWTQDSLFFLTARAVDDGQLYVVCISRGVRDLLTPGDRVLIKDDGDGWYLYSIIEQRPDSGRSGS